MNTFYTLKTKLKNDIYQLIEYRRFKADLTQNTLKKSVDNIL